MILPSLDLLIGMVVVYLTLSLVVSALREAVEARLRTRSTHLATGIVQLLGGVGEARQFYDHHLVRGLYRSSDGSPGDELGGALAFAAGFRGLGAFKALWGLVGGALRKVARAELPTYIPARTFSLAMLDIALRDPVIAKRVCDLSGIVPGRPANADDLPLEKAQFYPALRTAILERASSRLAPPADAPPPPRWLKSMANALLSADGDDFAGGCKALDSWFNATMDRVSGWYKHESQSLLFWFGAILVVALNVDSIALVQHLSSTPETRQMLVDRAKEVQAQAMPDAATSADDSWGRLGAAIDQVNALNVPIGWNAEQQARILPRGRGVAWANLGSALIGWYMTALAISFGAPFWFDILNKIMIVRSTVKPSEKSPEDKSKEAAK
jgi:hypothetical protein